MNDTKIALGRHGENSTLETSSAFKDDALKDIVGGKGWYPTVDEKNKVICIRPDDINDYDNPYFRIAVREVYSAIMNQGFKLIFEAKDPANWGPQAK
ncbi:hypothetical protein KTQ42_05120|uniref:hypothetical protein n=1 Tax=Noviherbaspirillum sp. L7-7A TaxID=2850560 RepID=UPI001C2B8A0D|nr:hypothetical protein [Noviherbaspirillum sp. L7-7A]MBV0878683.1 hypothetical protein [Noviherbaspirillum sp. L7-7A]